MTWIGLADIVLAAIEWTFHARGDRALGLITLFALSLQGVWTLQNSVGSRNQTGDRTGVRLASNGVIRQARVKPLRGSQPR